jgi:MFS family permease
MSGSPPPESSFVHRRLRILVPLRHRDFRLLWTGMTVSLLGDGITTIALAWQAYEISNVATAFSMVMFAMAVPQVILLLIGGAVSDRFERRKVMIFADTIRMVALFGLGLLSVSGHLEIWHMMVIAAFYGAGTAFFGPAFDAIVPELVPEGELPQANALDQFVRPAAYRMLGPALGGALIAIFGTPGDAFLLDGVTFSISVACLILMRRHPPVGDEEERTSMVAEIKEGLGYVRTQTWLWGTFLAATLAYLVFWGPAEVLLPLVVKNDMHGSASQLGVILALGGVGAMATAIVMGNREMPRRHITFMYVVWTLSTFAIAGYGFATMPWHAMAFCFLFNALESAGLIVWITTKQRLVPARLMGRVSSFDWFISTALVPVSYALTGPVAKAFGAQPTLIGAGLLGGAVTLAFLFIPGMRDLERKGVLRGVPHEVGAEAALEAQAVPGSIPPVEALDLEPNVAAVAAVGNGAAPVVGANGSAVLTSAGPSRNGSTRRHLQPVDDPLGDAFRTLADLRLTLERRRDARDAAAADVEDLEREERRLEQALAGVRERLRALREEQPAAAEDSPAAATAAEAH